MLKNVEGKVIVTVDLDGKNWHTFSNGQKIRRERQYDNLNRRETEPVNAIVVSATNIPEGSEILIHPNAATETNQIFDYNKLSGKETASGIKYYSIGEDQCFIWKDGNEWKPIAPYETALRIFEPYKGILQNIEPTLIKDCLFVTSGNLKGKVVKTVKASDYQIVFQDSNGQEGNIIRFRPDGDGKNREPEAIAIMEKLTDKVNKGKLLIGLTKTDAKSILEYAN